MTNMNETPRVRFNWGFWDGRNDAMNHRQDRRRIPAGDLFCLPTGAWYPNAKHYKAGYAAGYGLGASPTDFEVSGNSGPAWKARAS